MAKQVDVDIRAVTKALNGVEPKLAKKVMRGSFKNVTKTLASDIKSAVPNKSGQTQKGVKVRAAKRSRSWFGSQVEIRSPAAAKQELGFKHKGDKKVRNATIRPTFDKKKDQLGNQIITEMKNIINKGAK